MGVQITSAFVANLETLDPYFDHFEVEVWDQGQTTLVQGPLHVAGKFIAASGLSVQDSAVIVRGLTGGQVYSFRSRVLPQFGGPPSAWSAWAQLTAGDTTAPNPTYAPTASVTAAGVIIDANPSGASADTNHYEFYQTSASGALVGVPAPNLPNSYDLTLAGVQLQIPVGAIAYVWVRAVDTSGNRQAWAPLGGFNSNGALVVSLGGTPTAVQNLTVSGGFGYATAQWGVPLSVTGGQPAVVQYTMEAALDPSFTQIVAVASGLQVLHHTLQLLGQELFAWIRVAASFPGGTLGPWTNAPAAVFVASSTAGNGQGSIPSSALSNGFLVANMKTNAGGFAVVKLISQQETVYRADGSTFVLPALSGIQVPAAPTLSQVAGGALAAHTVFARVALVKDNSMYGISNENSIAVGANNLAKVTSPTAVAGYDGYVVLASHTTNTEVLQQINPNQFIAFGTDWTEPTSGIVTTGPVNWSDDNAVGTYQGLRIWFFDSGGTGLAASTKFFFYPTWDQKNQLIRLPFGLTMLPDFGVASQIQWGDGFVSLAASSVTLTTPAANGSGGSAGGGGGGGGKQQL